MRMLSLLRVDARGNVALTFGLAAVVLAAIAGGAIDITSANADREALQGALDAAVLAGAKSDSSAEATAYFQKNLNVRGLTVGTPSFSQPSVTTFKGVVASSMPTSFLGIIGLRNIAINVSATAQAAPSSTVCILALDPTAGKAIKISGSAKIDSPDCDVVANSADAQAIETNGAANITVACLTAAGGISEGGKVTLAQCALPLTHASPQADPYASVAEPSVPARTFHRDRPSP